MPDPLSVGVRVTFRRSVIPAVGELHDAGTIVRVDARGVMVKLDSGREVLTEPGLLTIIVGPIAL